MFVEGDASEFKYSERVVGELGKTKRGKYGCGSQFVRWVSTSGLDEPAFTNIGRWRYGQEGSFENPVYVPWWTIDLDGPDVVEAYYDALKIVEVLDVEGYDLRRSYVSYSGRKGFHIQVSARQFGAPIFKDSDAARAVLYTWAEDVSEGAEIDPSVTSPQALIRVPTSKHEATEAYKRMWYAENFDGLDKEMIFRNVRQKKPIDFYDESDKVLRGPREHLAGLISDAKGVYNKIRKKNELGDDAPSNGIIGEIKPGLLEGQIFGDKPFHVGRENGAYILACWYLERYSERMAWERMKSWNRNNEPPLPQSRLRTQFRGGKRTIYEQR